MAKATGAPRRVSSTPAPDRPDVESYRKAAQAGPARRYQYVRLLGLRPAGPSEILKLLRHGLRFTTVERFLANSSFSTDDLADLVAIPPRTLHRRKEEGRLDPRESDRLLRVTRVFARALDLFEGDVDAAHRWFTTPARALGGERPTALAGTDPGSREVEMLIDRLEQGVLA